MTSEQMELGADAPERVRRLEWEGCFNARDLGGYRTKDGQETRWQAVVRADNLAPLTETGRRALIDYGVRTIVDLRLPQELALHPNPFAEPGAHRIAYHNISLIDPAAEPGPAFTTLAANYSGLLDRFRPQVGEVMTTISRAPEGGVLIHCMAGKDRTGVISALLLELAGVPRDVIGADYALTAEFLRAQDEDYLANGPGERADRERDLARRMPTAEVMPEVLAHLDREYGGVEAYLLGFGVPAEDIERLSARLVPGD